MGAPPAPPHPIRLQQRAAKGDLGCSGAPRGCRDAVNSMIWPTCGWCGCLTCRRAAPSLPPVVPPQSMQRFPLWTDAVLTLAVTCGNRPPAQLWRSDWVRPAAWPVKLAACLVCCCCWVFVPVPVCRARSCALLLVLRALLWRCTHTVRGGEKVVQSPVSAAVGISCPAAAATMWLGALAPPHAALLFCGPGPACYHVSDLSAYGVHVEPADTMLCNCGAGAAQVRQRTNVLGAALWRSLLLP